MHRVHVYALVSTFPKCLIHYRAHMVKSLLNASNEMAVAAINTPYPDLPKCVYKVMDRPFLPTAHLVMDAIPLVDHGSLKHGDLRL